MNNKIAIIAPFYNESKNLNKMLYYIKTLSTYYEYEFELFLHDDNSTDDSQIIIDKFVNTNNLKTTILKNNKENLGHGRSLIRLKNEVIKDKSFNYIATIDADLNIEFESFINLFRNLEKNQIIIGKRKRFNDGIFRSFITLILELIVFLRNKYFWRDVNCPVRIYPFDKFVYIWSRIPDNSLIPNVHVTEIILEKNLLYLRIQIPELNLVKNSGVTWSNLSLFSKYKRLVNFCFEAYKELKT